MLSNVIKVGLAWAASTLHRVCSYVAASLTSLGNHRLWSVPLLLLPFLWQFSPLTQLCPLFFSFLFFFSSSPFCTLIIISSNTRSNHILCIFNSGNIPVFLSFYFSYSHCNYRNSPVLRMRPMTKDKHWPALIIRKRAFLTKLLLLQLLQSQYSLILSLSLCPKWPLSCETLPQVW